ncbi:acyltransferase family protein [Corticibacterium sp. UT-5YL-CI-8]|nr:acyltransferase family protein [Tianweitania sp. UT-5YL-CI-8]
MSPAKNYRPEIDGLRTISVMAVLLYHYGIGPLPGGFVGVDVFFVISGYLITSIISAEMRTGKFSLWGFYDRRVRRILPASLLTIVVTGIAGYFILLPSDYAAFGWSAVASAFGLANFHFLWNSGGYFDSAADLMPLLHMWSLGVEEQFYVFWPLILWAVFTASKGSARAAVAVLAVIIAVSFGASVYLTHTDQPVAFYMLHTRAWELALGAILVFAPRISNRIAGEAASVTGLVLILGAIFLLSSKMPFPGVNALYPCIGAALIIWPKAAAPFAEWPLRTRPFTAIGLISFSLYLWHWPVLVLYRQLGIGDMPPVLDRVLLAALAFGLAIATYRYVETPFRHWHPPYKKAVAIGTVAAAAIGAAGAGLSWSGGYPARLSVELQELDAFRDHTVGMMTGNRDCFVSSANADFRRSCLNVSKSKPNVLLVGDSHLAMLAPALRERFPEINFLQSTRAGCRALMPFEKNSCGNQMRKAFQLVDAGKVQAVIMGGVWRASHAERLARTSNWLSSRVKQVVVIGPNLRYKQDLPLILAKDGKQVMKHSLLRKVRNVDEILRKKLNDTKVYWSLLDVFCSRKSCTPRTPEGFPTHFDNSHLTTYGAKLAVQRLARDGFLNNLAN